MKKSELKEVIKEVLSMDNEFYYEIKENKNPELDNKINTFIKNLAKYYGYSTYDAFLAIEQRMNYLKDFYGEGKFD